MTDPDLTPSEEQVRRLLADARHDQPMPDDVADRLDRALAELQDEARRTPPPVDLAARRRRRVARNLLVAAAAVVVLGVGISRVDLAGDADGGGSAGSDSDSSAASAPESARDSDIMVRGRPLVLTSENFERQARRASLHPLPASLAEGPQADASAGDNSVLGARGARPWCDDSGWGEGQRIPVRYDGRRGVLVLRPAAGDTREADLYLCGETVPTRSTTVPAG